MPLQIGQTLLGKYRTLDFIGEGSFGRVYLTEEELTRRRVAIKALRHDLPEAQQQEARERFDREIEVASQLEHDHIVRMITYERQDEDIYLVLEYMQEGSLRDRLKEEGALPADEALRIAMEVCEALDYIHNHPLDLVHRDVSPSNIMFTADGTAKLMDFGVVQSPGYTFTRWAGGKGEHPGHPFYRAPEALRSEPLRPSADLYMLGCVLWEMLTSRTYKHQNPGTPPSALREELPSDVDTVVLKAVEEDARARYHTAAELRVALADVREPLQEKLKRHRHLLELLTAAKAATDVQDWETALRCCDELAELELTYPGLDDLRTRARAELAAEKKQEEKERRQAKLDVLYQEAVRLLEHDKYRQVLAELDELDRLEPGYPRLDDLRTLVQEKLQAESEVQERKRRQARVQDLYRQAVSHAKHERYRLALDSMAQLHQLAPEHPDPQEVLIQARRGLEAHEKSGRLTRKWIWLAAGIAGLISAAVVSRLILKGSGILGTVATVVARPTPGQATPETRLPTDTPFPTPSPWPDGKGGMLCVLAFHDLDEDTMRGTNEPMLPNAKMTVKDASGIVASYTTNGVTEPYCLTGLTPKSYRILYVSPAGYEPTGHPEQNVALASGTRFQFQFGNVQSNGSSPPPTLNPSGEGASVCVLAYSDVNSDGARQSDTEPLLAGAEFTLAQTSASEAGNLHISDALDGSHEFPGSDPTPCLGTGASTAGSRIGRAPGDTELLLGPSALAQQPAQESAPTNTPPPPPPTATPGPSPTPRPTPTQRPDGAIVHVVKAGDTLMGIALRYDVTREQIRELNRGSIGPDDLIYPGQELVISLPNEEPTPTPETASTVSKYATDGSREPYCFTAIEPGYYRISVVPPAGYVWTTRTTSQFALAHGTRLDFSFGFKQD